MEQIFTERAHLMCPHMNFGIAMCVDRVFDPGAINSSFDVLAGNHPFLRAVLGYDEKDNRYYYDVTDSSKMELLLFGEPLSGLEDPGLLKEYGRLTGYDWDIRKEGMLKAAAWRSGDNTVFLFVFHHLLADGRGAIQLAQEFVGIYAESRTGKPVSEKLISSAEDLPGDSKMPLISRMLVDKANRDWAKEGNEPLSYQKYHEFADDYVKNDKVKISLKKTSSDELAQKISGCREHQVTVNDLLMAEMYLKDKTDKIIIAKDLRDDLPFYNAGSLGNYSTAFSIVTKKHDSDVWTLAGEVHRKVKKAVSNNKDLYLVLQCYANLNPEVLDAAFMAAKGRFASKSAEFIGKMFFGFEEAKGYSITNLGKIDNKSITGAFFIPPASPAIRKTSGVLTVNGEMIECFCER